MRYKDEQAIIHSIILLQVSQSALTWATQKANAEAEPCKRCSRRIRDESGEQIKVYHGEQPSLLLTFHDSLCCTCSDNTPLAISLLMQVCSCYIGTEALSITLFCICSLPMCRTFWHCVCSWDHAATSKGRCVLADAN